MALNSEEATQVRARIIYTDWTEVEALLYDMYFGVANLRLGRGGEKPLE